MNQNEIKCPKCHYLFDKSQTSEVTESILKHVDNSKKRIAALSADNSLLVSELNRLVKRHEKKEAELQIKIKERDKVIKSLKDKIEALVKSTESAFASQESKGEAMELLLEERLKHAFPLDDIVEVKKGQRGADCIQVVKSENGDEIGRLIFESKNTKTFSQDWKTKLKQDALSSKAQVCILVSAVMPKGYNGKFLIEDGVWICRMTDVTELVLVLRISLLKLHSYSSAQNSKQTNKDKLFDYLSSDLFRNSCSNIIELFRSLQQAHQAEKLKMTLLWKTREQAMENILTQSIEFFSNIKGNAGVASFPELTTLQMDSQVD